jgi:hypothetical protein
MTETDLDEVQRLLDIEEIQQLKARYFRHVDTQNWDQNWDALA